MVVVKGKMGEGRTPVAATGATEVKRLNRLILKVKPVKRRRGEVELLLGLLEAVKNVGAKRGDGWAPKTPVMFTVATSPIVIQKYFDYAEERGLLARSGTKYKLTGKGASALSLLRRFTQLRVKLAEKNMEISELLGSADA